MFSKRAKLVPMSSVIGLFVAATCLAMATSLQAIDIAWHSKSEGVPPKESWIGAERTFERVGTAEFKTGEKATYVCNGMNHPLAAVPNKLPWDQQCVFRFDDLSALTIHMAGSFDSSTQETKGMGKFVSGTGRFEGIIGEVTATGHFTGYIVDTDWVGSYSLPR